MCDPVHGNTFTAENTVMSIKNIKTRSIKDVKEEIETAIQILRNGGEWLGGIHLEATPEIVNECLGEDTDLTNLGKDYRTKCDPRFNLVQTYSLIQGIGR